MPVEDLFDRGAALARDAEKEIEALEQQRAEIDEQIKRVRALMRLMKPPEPHKKRAAAKPKPTIADDTLVRVAKACLVLAKESPEGMFAVVDVAKGLDLHDSTVRFAFNQLREREFLRKLPGRINRREQFAVLDEHVLDLLTAAASENGHATA